MLEEEAVRLACPCSSSSASSPPPAATTTTPTDDTDDGRRRRHRPASDCPADVEGDVNVSGSSTVEPISAAVGEKLLDCSGIAATVDGPGTGDGFALFCDGETDISDASRPIKEEEAAACADNGVEFIELKVAFDGISVLTNPANDAVECLSFADLYALIGPGVRGRRQLERRAGPRHRAGLDHRAPRRRPRRSPPRAPSRAPTTASSRSSSATSPRPGPRPARSPRTRSRPARTDYASQADDTAIIAGHGGRATPRSAGSASPSPRRPATRSRSSACPPSPAASASRRRPRPSPTARYPISRGLYIYVNAANAEDNPAVAGYVDYYLSDEGIASVERGRLRRPARPTSSRPPAPSGRPGPPAPARADRPSTDRGRPYHRAGPGLAPARTEQGRPLSDVTLQPPQLQLSDLRGDPRRVRTERVVRGRAHRGRGDLRRSSAPGSSGRWPVRPSPSSPRSSGPRCCSSDGWFPRQGVYDIRTLLVGSLLGHGHRHGGRRPVGLGAAIYLSEYARPRVRKVAQADPRGAGRHPQRRARVLRRLGDLPVDRPALHRRRAVQPARRPGIGVGHPLDPARRLGVRGRAALACPRPLREASYGMGAKKITTVTQVVLPAAVSGLVAAFILAVSRAIGETMVVFIAGGAAGNQAVRARARSSRASPSPRRWPPGPGHRPGASARRSPSRASTSSGAVLFVITLVLNLVADRFVRRVRQAY